MRELRSWRRLFVATSFCFAAASISTVSLAQSASIQVSVSNVSSGDLNSLELWKNGIYQSAATNPSSPYTFAALTAGQTYRVDAYATDMFVGTTGNFTPVAGTNSRSIAATAKGTVNVTVYYSDGSTPLANATVSLIAHTSRTWRTCTTNTSGACSMSAHANASAGESWSLKVVSGGSTVSQGNSVNLTAGGTTSRTITTSLAVPPASIAVTVNGVNGSDLNSLELWKNGSFLTKATNPGTTYTFTNQSANQNYRVDAYATDMFVGNTGTFAAPPGTTNKTINATGQGTLTVTAYYSDGTTLYAGASLALVAHSGKTWRTCTTNSSGVCSMTAYANSQPGETWTLKTTSGGAPDQSVTLTANVTTTRTVIVNQSVPPASIAVTVNGVAATDLNSLELWKNGSFLTKATNPGTTYMFTNQTANQSYRVDAYATDMFVGNTGTFAAPPGTTNKTINATGQGTLTVTAYYSDGTTLYAGAALALVAHSGKTWRTCTTNSSGVCSMTAYPNTQPGETWTLKLTGGGASDQSVTLTANATTTRTMIVNQSAPPASIAVTVNGVAAADLNSLELWKNGNFLTKTANPGTPYTFANQTANQNYRVDAYATDMFVGNTGTFAAPPGTTNKTINATGQGTLTVTAYYSDGTTLFTGASLALVAHSGKTWRTCTTNSSGVCSMTAYPNSQPGETWTLKLTGGGASDQSVTLTANATTTRSMTIGLPVPPASIAVTVTSVSSSDLNSLELWKNGSFLTKTANPGTPYTFANQTANQSYRVDAYATDMLIGNTGTFSAPPGTTSKTITAPAQGTLTVTAYYSDGTTLYAGAALALVAHSGKTWRTCTTNSSGVCSMTAYPNSQPGETWTLKLTGGGASDQSVTLTANATTTRSMTIGLPVPPASIAVTVTSVSSSDLNSLELWKNGSFLTKTANPGTPYTFANQTANQSYRVDAYATDMLIGNTGTFSAPPGTTSKTITAPVQGTLTVTAYYSDGTTLFTGAALALVAHSGKTWRTCTTNSSGVCSMTAYPNTQPGETWTLKTTSGGSSIAADQSVTLTANATTQRSVTTNQSVTPATITVTVNGVTASDLNSLELWKNGAFARSVASPGVKYSFGSLDIGGAYRVDAYATDMFVGSSGNVTAVSGNLNSTIEAPEQGTAGVKVVYADGVTPLPGAEVSLVAHNGKTWRVCTTNSSGVCSFSAFPDRQSGEKWLLRTALASSVIADDQPIHLIAATTVSKTIVTRRTAEAPRLSVTVTGVSASELNSLELWEEGSFRMRVTNPGTQHLFENLQPGKKYRVDAYAMDMYVGTTGTFDAIGSLIQKTIAVAAPGMLGVTVTFADGTTPVPDASLVLTSHSQRTWRACRTDARGVCVFTAFANTRPGETWTVSTKVDNESVAPPVKVDIRSSQSTDVRIVTTLAEPKPTLLQPNGGEQWDAGSLKPIRWRVDGPATFSVVSLYYSRDDGKSWTLIAGELANTGEYLWAVPAETGENCLVRVSVLFKGREYADRSDRSFAVIAREQGPATLTLVALDPNPALLTQDGRLQPDLSGIAQLQSSVIGAGCDGVTKVILRTVSNRRGRVTFSVAPADVSRAGALGLLTNESPSGAEISVDAVEVSHGLYVAAVVYVPPLDFPEKNLARFAVQLSAALDGPDAQIANRITFELVRPPIVLVHGWSSWSRTWDLPLQRDARFANYWAVNYEATSKAAFGVNVPYVAAGVRLGIDNVRRRGFAVTQADVIGHSMGGILLRIAEDRSDYRRKENFFRGDYHKLITLDTPHLGTELGNLVQSLRGCRPCAVILREIDGGAIDDLAVGSAALKAMTRTAVPSHVVVGTGGDAFLNRTKWEAFVGAELVDPLKIWGVLALAAGEGLQAFAQNRFKGDHDLIVGAYSQRAGMIDGSTSTLLSDAIHTECTSAPVFSDLAIDLLNAPTRSPLFSELAEAPRSRFDFQVQSKIVAAATAEIPIDDTIQLTMSTTVARVGEVVRVGVTAPNPLIGALITTPCGTELVLSDRISLSCALPASTLGRGVVNVIARTTAGMKSLDGRIAVDRNGAHVTMVRILAPATILQAGQNLELPVLGKFSDGTERLLEARDVIYTSSDDFVAAIDASGIVTARHAGTAILKVTADGKEATMEIRVGESAAGRRPAVRH